jgi:hypothetical protein
MLGAGGKHTEQALTQLKEMLQLFLERCVAWTGLPGLNTLAFPFISLVDPTRLNSTNPTTARRRRGSRPSTARRATPSRPSAGPASRPSGELSLSL